MNSKKYNKIAYILIGIVFLVTLFYIWNFSGNGISGQTQDWSNFGSYFGGLISPLATIITLFWLTKTKDDEIERLEKDNQRLRDIEEKKNERSRILEDKKNKKQVLNIYLSRIESRLKLIRETYINKTIKAVQYTPLYRSLYRAKGWTFSGAREVGDSMKVNVQKNGMSRTEEYTYNTESLMILLDTLIKEIGNELVKVEINNLDKFKINLRYLELFAEEIEELKQIISEACTILDHLQIDKILVDSVKKELVYYVEIAHNLALINDDILEFYKS